MSVKWTVELSRHAEKFLERNHIDRGEIFELAGLAVKKFRGEPANIIIGKLKGAWTGFYKIRKGDLRLIVSFDFGRSSIFVDQIDWRGNVYK